MSKVQPGSNEHRLDGMTFVGQGRILDAGSTAKTELLFENGEVISDEMSGRGFEKVEYHAKAKGDRVEISARAENSQGHHMKLKGHLIDREMEATLTVTDGVGRPQLRMEFTGHVEHGQRAA